MSTIARIRTETQGAICWLTADNPGRLNSFTLDMWASLPRLIADAEEDPAVRVLVLTGQGEKAFSAGADISEFETARAGAAARTYDEINNRAFAALMDCTKPVIAMVNGLAFGGGCELVACCDFQIAAEHAVFSIPAAKLGIGYNPRWIRPLLALMSPRQAKEMLLTGRRYDARTARDIGLVGKVVTTANLRAETETLAAEIAANAPLSVRAAKAAVDALTHPNGTVDMERLDRLIDDCFQSDDYAEGRRAFMEKRTPRFSGR